MEYKDYYQILGVGKKADPAEIQKAYRSLARKYHPDVNNEPDAETRFKEIGEAYEVLKDPEKRAKYDQFGSAWKTAQRTGSAPPGWEQYDFGGEGFGFRSSGPGFGSGFGSSGFSSFFEMLFGGGGDAASPFAGFGGGPRTRRSRRGQDRESRIQLSLEDVARGGEHTLELVDPLQGRNRTLRVRVPKGIRESQKIRLTGQGEPGTEGAGDLYLVVQFLPHPRFAVDGFDLETTLPVPAWEAALGSEASIVTLNGTVTIKLPPGSSSGRRIRLRGKGLPRPDGAAGDLYVTIEVVVPKQLSDRERELFSELAQASTFRAGRNRRTPNPTKR